MCYKRYGFLVHAKNCYDTCQKGKCNYEGSGVLLCYQDKILSTIHHQSSEFPPDMMLERENGFIFNLFGFLKVITVQRENENHRETIKWRKQ